VIKPIKRSANKTARAIKRHDFEKDVIKGVSVADHSGRIINAGAPLAGPYAPAAYAAGSALKAGSLIGSAVVKSKLLKKKKR
jgi:hypothetical protein